MNNNVLKDISKKQNADGIVALSNYNHNSIVPSLLTLEMVGSKINLKHPESIKRWLNANEIKIHRLSKVSYVYELDMACALSIPFVKEIKKKYPSDWKDLYKEMENNDALYSMILYQLEKEFVYSQISKVKRKSQSDEKLYKKLTA